jgi:hypothetical protein
MSLPANVNYGTVTGTFITAVADGPDDDSLPDAVPCTGKVLFTPTASKLLNVTATPPVTIFPKSIAAVLDVNGAFSVVLVATDDPDLNPVGWQYVVSFALSGITVPAFNIDVLMNTTIDLASASPVPAAGGTPIVRGPGMPQGGTSGQYVVKGSETDFDFSFTSIAKGSTAPTSPVEGDIWYQYT